MEDLISSRQLVDLAIAITTLEGLAIALYYRITGKGLAPKEFVLNLISGLCLMLALRGALQESGWLWVAAWLLCSGVAHWTDAWRRWQRSTCGG